MKAVLLRSFGHELQMADIPRPRPKGEEVLVKVLGAGVCHSDLHIIDGRFPNLVLPLVLGHEVSGYVEDLGNVLVYASWGCGNCKHCMSEQEQLCEAATEPGWVRDGGYAEFLLVPTRRYLFPLEDLDPVHSAPLADAGLTSFRAVRRVQGRLSSRSTTLVIGAGGLGQFAIQYLKMLTDSKVIAVDRDENKLLLATGLGADEVFTPSTEMPRLQCVLDFVGSDETLALGTGNLERGGTLVVVGEAGGKVPFGFGRIPHESWLSTSVWGSRSDLKEVIDLARRKKITWPVEVLPLERANEAILRLRNGNVRGRQVLTP